MNALEAFEKYATHNRGCALAAMGPDARCSCGLEDAIAELERSGSDAKDAASWRRLGLMYEDELPPIMTDIEYNHWYQQSMLIFGVRMGPKLPATLPGFVPRRKLPVEKRRRK